MCVKEREIRVTCLSNIVLRRRGSRRWGADGAIRRRLQFRARQSDWPHWSARRASAKKASICPPPLRQMSSRRCKSNRRRLLDADSNRHKESSATRLGARERASTPTRALLPIGHFRLAAVPTRLRATFLQSLGPTHLGRSPFEFAQAGRWPVSVSSGLPARHMVGQRHRRRRAERAQEKRRRQNNGVCKSKQLQMSQLAEWRRSSAVH